MTIAVAAHSHCTPAAAAEMPFIDASSLLSFIGHQTQQEARFQAALAGAKLQ